MTTTKMTTTTTTTTSAKAAKALQAKVDALPTRVAADLAIYSVKNNSTSWAWQHMPLLLHRGMALNRRNVYQYAKDAGHREDVCVMCANDSAAAWRAFHLNEKTMEQAEIDGLIRAEEKMAEKLKGHGASGAGSVVAVAAGVEAPAGAAKKAPVLKKKPKKPANQGGGNAPKVNLDDLDAALAEVKTKDRESKKEVAKDKEATAGQALGLVVEEPMPKAEEPKEGRRLWSRCPRRRNRRRGGDCGGGTGHGGGGARGGVKKGKFQKNKPAADPTIKKNDDKTDNKTKRKVTPAEKTKKLAAAKAGTDIKAKPSTSNSTTSTPIASSIATAIPTTRTSRTHSTKAGSGALDTLASSASRQEATHRSTGSTGSDE